MTNRWSNEFKFILSSGSLLYNPKKNKNDILQGFGHYPFNIKTGECTRFIKCTLKWRTNYEIKSI